MGKTHFKPAAVVFLAAALLLTTSCAEILQRLALVNCRYSFHDIAPVNVGLTSLELRLAIKIDNPNAVEVILDRLGFDFFINDNQIFQGNMSERLNIASRGSSILEHVISISYLEAGLAIISAVKQGQAAYRLTGNAEFDTPVGPLIFPVDIFQGEIH